MGEVPNVMLALTRFAATATDEELVEVKEAVETVVEVIAVVGREDVLCTAVSPIESVAL